ncbi:MAG: Gfo/Idh/MocA family oxidoreductase [Armatimonadetes bacterium]|nr:Gfo/Idh/MocA family oxidoreductase [Armatimonadota bacterium]
MAEPLRVAVLGLVHDHVWSNIPNLLKADSVRVVAAADAHPELQRQFESKVSGAQAFADPHQCLDTTRPDAVLVCDTNARSVELVELAAERGLPCVLEKPMANRLAGADRALMACRRAGVPLIINWPTAWAPALWHAGRLVLSGAMGPIWQARYHAAHNGPKSVGCSEFFVDWLYDEAANGPGALMDYCGYGAALCRWLQGMPERVTAFAGRFVKSEAIPNDNAVMLLKYPNAISLLEASWTQIGALPFKGATINCVEGCIIPRGHDLLVTSAANPQGETIPADPAPPHLQNLGAYLTAVVREGQPPEGILDPQISRDAQAIMEAGVESIETGVARPVSA